MAYLVETVINGAIYGAIYALMALGFVVTFKTMRVANFALGEFILFGAGFAAFGYQVLGLNVPTALLGGFVAMALFTTAFNRLVFARVGQSQTITLLMLTIGLGAFMQALGALLFRGYPFVVPLPLARQTVNWGGVLLSLDELTVGGLAVVAIAGVGALFLWSRAGLAMRALAEDPGAAMAMGMDPRRYFTLAWALAGAIAVVDGVLWAALRGGGFGFAVVGLKVFPIVIIGGLDSMTGTILGGLLVGVLDSLAATYLDPLLGDSVSQIISFVVLIAVLMVRPQGLFGSARIERV
jgi:branched-chain amino acid transport system permease protein